MVKNISNADRIAYEFMIWSRRNYRVTVSNFFWRGFECDFLAFEFKKMVAIEYELKVTRADFLKDKRKAKKGWHYFDNGRYIERLRSECPKKLDIEIMKDRVNKFYYIVPEGLVDKSEIPDYAGLLQHVGRNNFQLIKHAKFLSKEPQPKEILESLIYKLDNRCWNMQQRYKTHR